MPRKKNKMLTFDDYQHHYKKLANDIYKRIGAAGDPSNELNKLDVPCKSVTSEHDKYAYAHVSAYREDRGINTVEQAYQHLREEGKDLVDYWDFQRRLSHWIAIVEIKKYLYELQNAE